MLATKKMISSVILKLAVLIGLLLLPAGTCSWWRAWTLFGVACVGSIISLLTVFKDNEGLLEERFKPPIQPGQPLADKIVLMLFIAAFLVMLFIIPFDVFRCHDVLKPNVWVSSFGMVMFIVGWWLVSLAMKTNTFAAPVVKHQTERHQIVVDTGIYGWVRHPMYLGGVILMMGIPLWLESYMGTVFSLVPIVLLMVRIGIEERFLKRELPGYEAYTQRVRYRLIPFIW